VTLFLDIRLALNICSTAGFLPCPQVYLVGGYDADGPTYHNSLYMLDLTAGRQWKQLPSMLHKRCYIGEVVFQVGPQAATMQYLCICTSMSTPALLGET
jgi:hypothetical protein